MIAITPQVQTWKMTIQKYINSIHMHSTMNGATAGTISQMIWAGQEGHYPQLQALSKCPLFQSSVLSLPPG